MTEGDFLLFTFNARTVASVDFLLFAFNARNGASVELRQ
jgi:hypothetical protein